MLNPTQVKNFKKAYNDLPKNDPVGAYIIADCLRFGRIRNEVYVDDYRYEALRTLTRARFYAVQNLAREKQRFGNLLFKKCCGLAQDKDIKNTASSTIALMENFETIDDLANANLEEISTFLRTASRGRFADPDKTAKTIQIAARGSYRLPKTVNDSVNQAMSIDIFTSVNQHRSSNSRSALTLSPEPTELAMKRAAECALLQPHETQRL